MENEKFVLILPEWGDKLQFSQEWVTLILVVITFISGIVLSFIGHRYFGKIIPIIAGAVSGMTGYHIVAGITENRMLQMYIFVIVTLLSICICGLITSFSRYVIKRLGLESFTNRYLYILSPLTGALISGLVFWKWIYVDGLGALCSAAILMGLGIWNGLRCRKQTRVFYTYDNIANVKLGNVEEEDA